MEPDLTQLWRYGKHEDYLSLIGLLPDAAKQQLREEIAARERDRARREQIYKQEIETYKRSANPTKEEDDLYLSLLAQHIESLDEDIQIALEQERVFSETLNQCAQYTASFPNKEQDQKQEFCGQYADLANQVYETAAKKVETCETTLRALSAKLSIEQRLLPRETYSLKTKTARKPLLTEVQGVDFGTQTAGKFFETEEEEEGDAELPGSAILREQDATTTTTATSTATSAELKNREKRRRRAKIALATAIETEARRRQLK